MHTGSPSQQERRDAAQESAATARSRPAARGATPGRTRPLSRLAFYAHLWLGVIFTIGLIAISVTGIMLNHKRGLGLMPDVSHEPTQGIEQSLSLARLAEIGLQAAAAPGTEPGGVQDIDRMDVRPRNGYVKIRLRDAASSEVTVDIADGRVLDVGTRGDAFLEKLHSGEVFGERGVLLSDAAAIALVITLITGYWLWLAPKMRRQGESPSADPKVNR